VPASGRSTGPDHSTRLDLIIVGRGVLPNPRSAALLDALDGIGDLEDGDHRPWTGRRNGLVVMAVHADEGLRNRFTLPDVHK
jgi:hypothetical protein